jgi:peptide/nickel transport system permease protein
MRPLTKIGLSLMTVILGIALLAPVLARKNPNTFDLAKKFESPSSEAFFGLDQNGADVFSQVLYGARTSLSIAIAVVMISASVGLLIGSWSAYRGGWIDVVTTRVLDMVQAFPGFLLALALVAVMGPSARNLVFAMCITGWAGYARLVRGEVLHLKEREYVRGAEASGASRSRILVRHIWPNLMSLLAVQATFGLAGVILAESGLSFLGLGLPPDTPTWGSLLNQGRRFLTEAPHISFFPGLALSLVVLSIQLCGEGLREWLNPRERAANI